jgi:Zn-dependent peptidase ImmA (M78 family)
LNIGVYVFKQNFQDNQISGLCLFDDIFPIICVNNYFAFSRQIFTLFHEIYHLIHATSGVDFFDDTLVSEISTNQIEARCNEFAGTFLIPDDDFLSTIGGCQIDDDNVRRWAGKYAVSREVVFRKLLKNGLIDSRFYGDKKAELEKEYIRINDKSSDPGKHGGGGSFYNTHISYIGKNYVEQAYSQFYSNKITLSQLAEYVDMKIPNVQRLASMHGWGDVS